MDTEMEDLNEDLKGDQWLKAKIGEREREWSKINENMNEVARQIVDAENSLKQAMNDRERMYYQKSVSELRVEKLEILKLLMASFDDRKLWTSRLLEKYGQSSISASTVRGEVKNVFSRQRTAVARDVQGNTDCSEELLSRMLARKKQEFPNNSVEVEEILFPGSEFSRLPVPVKIYDYLVGKPKGIQKYIYPADDSVLPCCLGASVVQEVGNVTTEMDTTVMVGAAIKLVRWIFKTFKESEWEFKISLNSTESGSSSRSETIGGKFRPDTIGTIENCTVLVGEDKLNDINEAEEDIRSKVRPLNPMFYGELPFILGYAAAGFKFKWLYIGRGGGSEMYYLGKTLDLSSVVDRCKFMISLIQGVQLLTEMFGKTVYIPGKRGMFDVITSSDGRRKIMYLGDRLVKTIKNFDDHCREQETCLADIEKAYNATKEAAISGACSFLLQAVRGPHMVKSTTYEVVLSPLGYPCTVKSEDDARWLARCISRSLVFLHAVGLVHRDIRVPNIVNVDRSKFMLIDFESVTTSPFIVSKGFIQFAHWECAMFEQGCYTEKSDMFSLGAVLRSLLPSGSSMDAWNFVNKLQSTKLSAEEALMEPWII